jgi:hypothetical protein
MPGLILGIMGKQRSGKTLIAYKLVKYLKQSLDIPVYTNIRSVEDGFHWINSLEDFPLDLSPKILFIDEVYNGTDAQDYKKLKDISIFLNTIGKQNCLFVYTTIAPEMVYNRLRNQTQIAISVNSDDKSIFYRWVDFSRNVVHDFQVQKSKELFQDVRYDTSFIPLDFDWNMANWREKLKAFYIEQFNLDISSYI